MSLFIRKVLTTIFLGFFPQAFFINLGLSAASLGVFLLAKTYFMKAVSFVVSQTIHLVFAYTIGKRVLDFIFEKIDIYLLVNNSFLGLSPMITKFWGCYDISTALSVLLSNIALQIWIAHVIRSLQK